MSLPALIVQQQGLGAVTADQLNTSVMGGVMLADLQGFIAVTGMCAYMVGYTAVGDGGQGMWTWNAGITSGNNTTTILPNGSIVGGWQRLGLDTP